MLAPKFTIRHLMLVILVFGIASAIFGMSMRGSVLAYGMALAMLGLVIPFLAYAAFYWIFRSLSGVVKPKFGRRAD